MENKCMHLAIVSMIGIIISIIALRILCSLDNVWAVNPLSMRYMVSSEIAVNNNLNMYAPTAQIGFNNIQQQLIDIKTFIGLGMPMAIGFGLLNFWRSFEK